MGMGQGSSQSQERQGDGQETEQVGCLSGAERMPVITPRL